MTFDITVESDEIAVFVWLEAVDIAGHFSDNGFLMLDSSVVVQFLASATVTAEELTDAIEIMSLWSLYTRK